MATSEEFFVERGQLKILNSEIAHSEIFLSKTFDCENDTFTECRHSKVLIFETLKFICLISVTQNITISLQANFLSKSFSCKKKLFKCAAGKILNQKITGAKSEKH